MKELCCFSSNTANAYGKLYASVKCLSTLNPKLGEHGEHISIFFAYIFFPHFAVVAVAFTFCCNCVVVALQKGTKKNTIKKCQLIEHFFFSFSNTKQRSESICAT